ncbi:MAG: type I DNA topoisomerase, partial [Firmicutes bacterium]|nr:type I DNA topoisomerase [Bacillota bacterium]
MKDKALVIVESPSKAKTIGKILGSRYKVVASVGHVRDLPKSKLGIDIDNNFEPKYISIRGKGDVIKMLKKEAKAASKVFLATDPDREGEAISWHIAHILGINPDTACRIEFNEITKNAIKTAIKNPRKINLDLVDAQQARRVLDRLVGYQISPLLWRKIKRGLSAGRVQSAALKILCDRENEIEAFIPEEYWTIGATFEKSRKKFKGELVKYNGKKIVPADKAETDAIISVLEKGKYTVARVEEKERIKKPQAPFTTSTLQQTAANRLNFNTKKTMMIAQQLYEGIDIKKRGTVGLVTYIRTDSVRISAEARSTVSAMIEEEYGKEYLGNNFYSNKKNDVQDAHEAIRPSDPYLKPDDIKDSLTRDQFKLYDLIWRRFVASQMTNAVFDAVSADIDNSGYTFRATGSKIKFDGYLAVYDNKSDEDKNLLLPPLEEGEELKLISLKDEQHFTQPPSRYSEAALVKEMEDKNIGRPSTYAPTVGTLTTRKYVTRESKKLKPTDLGKMVNELMESYFKQIVDVGFTADMEDQLDSVELESADWHKVISDFYVDFEKDLKHADDAIEKVVIEDEPTGEICPECGKPLVIKHGRFGEFIACSGYPECKTTKPVIHKLGVACPKCGNDLIIRKGRTGKVFYGCSGYPECNQVYWNKPVNRTCPECGSLMTEKKTKNYDFICSDAKCGHKEKGDDT